MDFIISDLHYSHKRIIEYENRPFNSVKEMNECITDNWNSTVNVNDTTYILGDVMFSRDHNAIIDFLNNLKGKIVIILGNHDEPLYKLYNKNLFRDRKGKIFIAGQIYEPKVDIGYNKFEKVVMCHYQMAAWNAAHHNRKLFYGHTHSKTNLSIKNSYNCCVEEIGYTPLRFNEVLLHYKNKYGV